MSTFWEGFTKQAGLGSIVRKAGAHILKHKGKYVAGGTAAGLGAAKAVQPHDTIAQTSDVFSPSSKKGWTPHGRLTQKRPLFFGRRKHMERVKNPRKFAIASTSGPHAYRKSMKDIAGKLDAKHEIYPEHKSDWLAAREKSKDTTYRQKGTSKWKHPDRAMLSKIYEGKDRK